MAIPTAAVSTCDPLLDENAAAEFLRMSAKTLRRWRCIGGGPEFIKVGRLVRYQRSGLEHFIRARTRISTSDGGGGNARPAP
jgi:hypothetical protein